MERQAIAMMAGHRRSQPIVATRPKTNATREARIEQEIVVDAYTCEERAMAWYYYLEQNLRFPFNARCTRRLAISPLRVGESVSVSRLASERICEAEILVITRWQGRPLGVPLAQLTPLAVDSDTKTAIGDWHYWVARGYQY